MTAIPDPSDPDTERFVEALFSWMIATGQTSYDESVTQLEHALQAAHLARSAGDSDAAVAAALLHDVGHLLLDEQREDPGFLASDLEHEAAAANWLSAVFTAAVTGPIRDHVRAKRYLCFIDVDYANRLSASSTRSLQVQGGPMTADEAREFETLAWHGASVTLRKRDEGAKLAGKVVPTIDTYTGAVLACIAR